MKNIDVIFKGIFARLARLERKIDMAQGLTQGTASVLHDRADTNESSIGDTQNAVCEESMMTDARITDLENALCELSNSLV